MARGAQTVLVTKSLTCARACNCPYSRMHLHLHGFVDSLQQSSSNNCCSAVVQVIVISFTLIISLMLGTFAFVLKVGAIRIND